MRAVTCTSPNVLELSWMWLPSFIGHDTGLKKEIEKMLAKELEGKGMTDDVLDMAHNRVLDIICERYKAVVGLRDYLDSLKFVEGTT